MKINKLSSKENKIGKIFFSHISFISLVLVMLVFFITLIPSISAANYYYNTSSTVIGGWNRGTGTTYTEIVDATREPFVPVTSAFVASRANDGDVSDFGFPSVTESDIENITLWVYTNTGSNAEYTFELRQSGTLRCSNLVPTGTGSGWRSCAWTSVSGDLSSLSVYLGAVNKNGGGGPTNGVVYSAYIEVDTGNAPPTVTLINPDNDSVINSKPFNFQFNVTDTVFSNMSYCDLYTNFTGGWTNTSRLNDVQNDTTYNFSESLSEGKYKWNVLCNNSDKVDFATSNRTVTVNAITPLIKDSQFNDTSIRQNRSVIFSTNITDYYGIDDALITLKYPNHTNVNMSLNPVGDIYSVEINDTLEAGTYSIELIWANDTLGQIGSDDSPSLSFEVLAIPPDEFDLLTPSNDLETVNATPLLTWEQTATPDFKNYTIQVSTDSGFGSIDFSYSKDLIDSTSHDVVSAWNNDTTYYWRVIAYDVFGNSRISTNSFLYITDNTPPSVSLNLPSDLNYTTSIFTSFYFTPTDANTLDSCILYTDKLDLWNADNSTNSPNKDVQNNLSTTLEEGPNVWNVICYDLAGNSDFAISNRTILLDIKGPAINLSSPQNDSLINTTNIVTFVAEANDSLSAIDNCSLFVNSTFKDNVPASNDVSFNFTIFLDNAYYEWNVKCWDINGNQNTSITRYVNVSSLDNDPPIVNPMDPADNEYISTSSYSFNYSVSEATGIEFCEFYLDDVFQENSTTVDKSGYNIFNITGLTNPSYVWRIECVDNSSESNRGIGENRTFYVDLVDPDVELNSPANLTKYNETLIFFNYIPTDDNLDYCDFYTNETGVFDTFQQETSPISGSTNSFNNIINDGNYIWNVYCVDLAGRGKFAPSNWSFSVDTISPKYSNINIIPSSPSNYSNVTYTFNITWTDSSGMDTVFIEHNFSGSLNSYEINTSVNNVYSYNISNLTVGSYTYRWIGTDTYGNSNSTSSFTYIVNKSDPVINLYLDGSQSNITINENNSVNLTGLISLPIGGNISLFVNDVLVNTSSNEVSSNYTFVNPGSYNITLIYQSSVNYNYYSTTYYVIVMDTTLPVVTLVNPQNDSIVSTGVVNLQFSVSDFSNIDACSLYVNNTFEDSSSVISKDIVQFFSFSTNTTSYYWRVECNDTYSNDGVSETRYFAAMDMSEMKLNITYNATSLEVGKLLNVSYNVTDLYNNSLHVNVSTSVIDVNTSKPWWNFDYPKRKIIYLTETQGADQNNSLALVNISGLSGITNCNQLRIVNQEIADISSQLYNIFDGDDSFWCSVAFNVNLSASETNNENYYVYFGNSSVGSPSQFLNTRTWTNFYAVASAADEGTPTNVANIIGFTDGTFATLTQGGGTGTHSAHGRDMVAGLRGDDISSVSVRYRYAVPTAASLTSWQLRYSVDGGASYYLANSGSSAVTKRSSSWYNITNYYPSLTWTNLNNTRLQARISKSGGGSNTMELYWVEMNVSHSMVPNITQSSVSSDQNLIVGNKEETSFLGLLSWEWNTSGLTPGNYSVVSLATKFGFNTAYNYTSIEMTTDVTDPNVTLLYPYDTSKIDKGYYDFNFTVYDTNIDNCTLYIGNSNFDPNETISASNGLNQFTNINLNYGNYTWNVLCEDVYGHSDFANSNFTFKVIVPTPNVTTEVDQTNFTLTWDAVTDANSYNIYISDDFASGFGGTPNETGITDTNFTFSSTDNIKFFKITAIVGGIESDEASYAGYFTQSYKEGFNFVSFPFLLGNYTLKDATNSGFKFSFDNDCLLSLWRYDSATESYDRTDWLGGNFVPATGSEDFTELSSQEGYFVETNGSCNLKFGGRVPITNESYDLVSGVNSVSWLSVEEKTLPTDYNPSLINTVPSNSVQTINRFNSTTQLYEITNLFFVTGTPWGWWPSFNNQHFTSLVPGEAYYFESQQQSTWNHEP